MIETPTISVFGTAPGAHLDLGMAYLRALACRRVAIGANASATRTTGTENEILDDLLAGFHWSWELSLKNQPEEDAAEAKPGSRRTSSGSHECHSPRVLRTRNLKSEWFFNDTSSQDDWFFNDTHWQATNWPGGDTEFPKGGVESCGLRPPPGRTN